jgi:hypothetical protein
VNKRSFVTALVILATTLPLSGAGAAEGACRVNTYDALDLGGYYLYGTAKEIWQEGNGLPGLQRTASYCEDGTTLAPDACIWHSESFAAIECGFALAGSI